MSRRPDDYNKSNNFGAVYDEVKKLFKQKNKSKIDSSKMSELLKKYQDSAVVEAIQQQFYEKYERVNKIAKKLLKKVNDGQDRNIPLHSILGLVKKASKKYELEDFEYVELKRQFENMYYSSKANFEPEMGPHTLMSQLFGNPGSTDGLTVKDSDYPAVQEILKLHTVSQSTHRNVILQSMQYTSCAPEVINAVFDTTRHNTMNAANPLLVALFVPKIDMFEQRFLYANLSYIVKCKYERKNIEPRADVHFLHSLIVDSRDMICSSESAISDIRLRCNLQNNLWNNVLPMRSGNFFDPVSNDFFTAIDNCKVSSADAPDLAIIGDEGVFLKRLLSSFAVNPLVVTTEPVYGVSGVNNPINFPIIHNRVAMRPYITVRLDVAQTNVPKALSELDSSPQIFYENGSPVVKKQVITKTSGVLIFHVPRRASYVKDSSEYFYAMQPRFHTIPTHILSSERVNFNPIDFAEVQTMGDNDHYFKSCLFLETPTIENTEDEDTKRKLESMVIGVSTLVACYDVGMNFTSTYKVYAPKLMLRDAQKNPNQYNQYSVFQDITPEEFDVIVRNRATVFVFSADM